MGLDPHHMRVAQLMHHGPWQMASHKLIDIIDELETGRVAGRQTKVISAAATMAAE